MPAYTVRVQLIGEPNQNIYDDLHSRMKKGGFLRTITGETTRDLPHGTYYGSSTKTVTEVRDWTKQQAKSAWGKSTIFIAQMETWSWGRS